MKKKAFAVILFALTAALSGCQGGGEEQEQAGAAPSAGYFSDFELETFDRESTVTEAQFEDYDLTMINIWATFCGPCINEMPDLQELSEEYADKGLQVMGLCSDVYTGEGIDERLMLEGEEVLSVTGAEYLQVIPNSDTAEELLSDVLAVPTTYFVDSEGNTLKIVIGAKSKEDWKTIIDGLLPAEDETEEAAG